VIHWCGEETAALVGILGGVRIAWGWLKTRLLAWRRPKPVLEKAPRPEKKPLTEMERVAAMMRGDPPQ